MATPKDVPGINRMEPMAAYNRGRQDAKADARREARQEVLTMLETRYMDESIERGSPVGTALLQLARELAEEYRARGI